MSETNFEYIRPAKLLIVSEQSHLHLIFKLVYASDIISVPYLQGDFQTVSYLPEQKLRTYFISGFSGDNLTTGNFIQGMGEYAQVIALFPGHSAPEVCFGVRFE